MFAYDKKENVLQISKIKLPPKGYQYEESEMYQSYMNYITEGIKADIKNIFVPALNNRVNKLLNTFIVKDIKVVKDNFGSWQHYDSYSVMVEWEVSKIMQTPPPFCLFKLPVMDKYGVLTREGKRYAMIAELVQADDITYDKQDIKIVTAGNCFLTLGEGPRNPKFSFRKKNISALTVLHALAADEGLDSKELFDKLLSKDARAMYVDERAFEVDREIKVNNGEIRSFVQMLNSPRYSMHVVRPNLNRALSLDRAIGHKLSRDVVLFGKEYKIDDIIDENFIRLCKLAKVCELYVKDIPNMMGYFLQDEIKLPFIITGTTLGPAIKGAIMDNYASHDVDASELLKGTNVAKTIYPIERPFFSIPALTQVDETLLEALYYNGLVEVNLVSSEKSTRSINVPFEVSIVSNRHFKISELGLSKEEMTDAGVNIKDGWVYVDRDGQIQPAKTQLTADDLVALLSLYDRVYYGYDVNSIASLDLGLRKKVKLAYESFHTAFENASADYVRRIGSTLVKKLANSPTDFLDKDMMEALFFKFSKIWWSKLYTELKVIQNIEMTNPVAFYSSFRKVNTIVADKNAISNSQHSITMGHYGRICPYETPSGKTMGIVGNKAVGCRIIDNILKTSYYKVHSIAGRPTIDFSKKYWFSVEQEEKYRIADITSLDFDENGTITSTGRVLARVPNVGGLEKMTVAYIDVTAIDFINTEPNQHDSLTATTIPCQGANDSARVVFGLSMCKQAKALVNAEVPIVLTSAFKDVPRQSPYFAIFAEDSGTVEEVKPGFLVMEYDNLGNVVYEVDASEFYRDSVVIRYFECEEGQRVNPGDLLVSSNFTKGQFLATGVNMLEGFVPEGANYEDGIFCSERGAHKLTSYGPVTESWSMTNKLENHVLMPPNTFRYYQKGSSTCSIKIGATKDPKVLHSKKLKGFIVRAEIHSDKYSPKHITVDEAGLSLDPLNQGDKLANRHGNKGVTPRIISNTEMPQFMNGEFLDLCKNPTGVASRMNIGQILECNMGLCGYITKTFVQADSFNGASEEEVKLLLEFTHALANEDNPNEVVSHYPQLPEDFKLHCLENIDNIHNWKGCFNPDGTAWMYNPRTGKMFESPMVVGVNYEYKLYHEVAKKEHARGGMLTEPYVEKLDAPPKGSSNCGGQRFGYMEMDALGAYGASAFMQELQNERGDNGVARNNFTVERAHTGTRYMLDQTTAIRRSTEYFINMMEAEGIVIDFEGELPNNTVSENLRRQAYNKNTILTANDVQEDSSHNTGSISKLSKSLKEVE